MSMLDERAGRQWAAETCELFARDLFKLPNGVDQLMAKLEAGKVGKPTGYARGIQKVIDAVKAGLKKLSKHQKKIAQPPGLKVDKAWVEENREL